jgi:hypothetical protein
MDPAVTRANVSKDAESLYQAGVRALRDEHDAESARVLLTEALRLDPRNVNGWLWLSRAYPRNQAQAQRCIERALSIDPDNKAGLKALMRLPDADSAIERLVSLMLPTEPQTALDLLTRALELQPNSRRLLVRMGELQTRFEQPNEAARYYDRAARSGVDTQAGQQADQALRDLPPLLTDHERGSVGLAAREAVGIGVFYVLLAIQDAGLSISAVGAARWAGVGLSLVGGYLLVTATSSPQQPLARWFGGSVPAASAQTDSARGPLREETRLPILPEGLRWLFGAVGVIVLLMAFALVFSRSLTLLAHPITPPVPVEP